MTKETKAQRYFREMNFHLSQSLKQFETLDNVTLGDSYWAQDDSLNIYKEVLKVVELQARNNKRNFKSFKRIDEIEYNLRTKKIELIKEYCERRIVICTK